MPLTINVLPTGAIVKESTQPLHREVEELLLPKLTAISSRAEYAAILKMFYGYFFPLEQRIQRLITANELPDIAERRKAAFILRDLESINVSTGDMALCTGLPFMENEAQAFGALYVLEGSTLGGKMIAKMLLKNQALAISEDAVHFFSGYRDETGSKWKAFLEVLNQQTQADAVVRAANHTFFHLKCWMQQCFRHE